MSTLALPRRSFATAFGILFFLGALAVLPAQIVFTVTGTAKTTAAGYLLNNSYTFVFTSQSGFSDNVDSSFNATSNYWGEETAAEGPIWTAITSPSLTGTYSRPGGNNTSAFIQVYDAPSLSFGAGVHNGSGANIGLITPNTTLVGTITVSANGGTLPNFTYPAGYTDPVGYFSAYNGTYTGFDNLQVILIKDTANTPLVGFAITSLSINAVPEPATGAALAGLGALGLAVWRRRRAA